LKRLRDEGPDAQLQADLESARRELARIEKGQQRLISRFRQAADDDLWPLIEREIAQAEREKGQLKAVVAEIESRPASQAASVSNLECLSATVRAFVSSLTHSVSTKNVSPLGRG
jgi:hypothetical protein